MLAGIYLSVGARHIALGCSGRLQSRRTWFLGTPSWIHRYFSTTLAQSIYASSAGHPRHDSGNGPRVSAICILDRARSHGRHQRTRRPSQCPNIPERLSTEDASSTRYFRKSLTLMRRLCTGGHAETGHSDLQTCPLERTRASGHWQENVWRGAAYRISRSEEYAGLEVLWREREKACHRRLASTDGKGRAAASPSPSPSPSPIGGMPQRPAPATSVFLDPRSSHQEHDDLFYRPPANSDHTRFALDILNIAPSELSAKKLAALKQWLQNLQDDDWLTFTQYLQFHGVAHHEVTPPASRQDRHAMSGLTDGEIRRFVRLARCSG